MMKRLEERKTFQIKWNPEYRAQIEINQIGDKKTQRTHEWVGRLYFLSTWEMTLKASVCWCVLHHLPMSKKPFQTPESARATYFPEETIWQNLAHFLQRLARCAQVWKSGSVCTCSYVSSLQDLQDTERDQKGSVMQEKVMMAGFWTWFQV